MKIAHIGHALIMLVALFATAGVARPENPVGPAILGLGGSSALTELLAGSHWAWYEGEFFRYSKNMPYWIEFYKDGTARVPWRDHPQYWALVDNVLTVSDSGKNGDKHIFTMNPDNKSGSAANQNLHIRYEKRASKPARWK